MSDNVFEKPGIYVCYTQKIMADKFEFRDGLLVASYCGKDVFMVPDYLVHHVAHADNLATFQSQIAALPEPQ